MSTQFKIVSSRTVEQAGGKKFVTYGVQIISQTDTEPVVIERRYTDFLQLYLNLCRDNPKLAFAFPKKVLLGNFSIKVIAARQESFKSFLTLISTNEKLKESAEMKQFLIGAEEREALKLMRLECFNLAKPLLIKMFTVLNKVYTERNPVVLTTLCRLAACCSADPSSLADAHNYSEIALRRYAGLPVCFSCNFCFSGSSRLVTSICCACTCH